MGKREVARPGHHYRKTIVKTRMFSYLLRYHVAKSYVLLQISTELSLTNRDAEYIYTIIGNQNMKTMY